MEPKNQTVKEDTSYRVDCIATGYPEPEIKWSYSNGTEVKAVMRLF